jgi:DNA-binding Xre family transcriptional regulator
MSGSSRVLHYPFSILRSLIEGLHLLADQRLRPCGNAKGEAVLAHATVGGLGEVWARARAVHRVRCLGLSQRELARRTHIPQPTISDLERGVQEDITTSLLKRLARALGCTTDYLIDIYDEETGAAPLVGARKR